MKTLLTTILVLVTILINAQSTKFIQYKATEKYAFIDSVDFDSATEYDCTRPDYIYLFGSKLKDYCYVRDVVEDIIVKQGFYTLKDKSKDAVGVYCTAPMDTLIAYYMGTGLSQMKATIKYINNRDVDVGNAAACYCERMSNTNYRIELLGDTISLNGALMLFIGEDQALTLNSALRNFKLDLCSVALLGTQYGDDRDGIMDYLESTGSYVGGGLKSYTMSAFVVSIYVTQDLARLALIDAIKQFLILGNYINE